MNSHVVSYYRPERGKFRNKPIGAVVLQETNSDSHDDGPMIRFGWSLCHPNDVNNFSKRRGREVAVVRMLNRKWAAFTNDGTQCKPITLEFRLFDAERIIRMKKYILPQSLHATFDKLVQSFRDRHNRQNNPFQPTPTKADDLVSISEAQNQWPSHEPTTDEIRYAHIDKEDIYKKIDQIFREKLGLFHINPNDSLPLIYGLDELDEVEVSMDLEDEFQVALKDDQLAACSTVNNYVELIHNALTNPSQYQLSRA